MHLWPEMKFFTLPPSATALARWLKIIELCGECSTERENISRSSKYERIKGRGWKLKHWDFSIYIYTYKQDYSTTLHFRLFINKELAWGDTFHRKILFCFTCCCHAHSQSQIKKRDVHGLVPYWVVNPIPAFWLYRTDRYESNVFIETMQDLWVLTMKDTFSEAPNSCHISLHTAGQADRRKRDAHNQLMTQTLNSSWPLRREEYIKKPNLPAHFINHYSQTTSLHGRLFQPGFQIPNAPTRYVKVTVKDRLEVPTV